MAFTTSGVQYNFVGTNLTIVIPISSETPTLAQLDAAMTAFCDELHAQSGAPTYVYRTVTQDEPTFNWWQEP